MGEAHSVKDILANTAEKGLSSKDWRVRAAALNACVSKGGSLEVLEQMLKDESRYVRAIAKKACRDRNVPTDVITRWLEDEDWHMRDAAMAVCWFRSDIPVEVIKKGLEDEEFPVRVSALRACLGRDVPFEIIDRGLKDDFLPVRITAAQVCQANGIEVPPSRTFEPPDLVYKKCVGGVIVVAEIPKDAHVRGRPGLKCRASKAIIKDVIGGLFGESVGISIYNCDTAYYAGDEIEIQNFDFGEAECAAGFHFFCTLEEARSFKV